ncbi:hypothetical protein [Streptomyces sp. WAC08241]|uniref:hypothetical protein n=1 Tax=Streptomyces sp. WAC08241 TaxID=2487421 RepID=UPI000F7A03E6|nr:hypothetical protein [Streptomyces sp. WAC08241]RSS41854.1 hypothetical protein EF906_13485 [Streptomyces sp. WAC08241]
MFPNSPLITFEKKGSHVRAWINASTALSAAGTSERNHRYGYLTTPLRQRGLECTVEFGLSDYFVRAELPDDSSLVISPPQERPLGDTEPVEGWTVQRHRHSPPQVYELIYDSEPNGPDARHGGDVQTLLAAIDERLDQLGVPPRQKQERSADELAAGTVLYRAGFVPAVAFGGEDYYRLPSTMTDPAEQRVVVTRAFDLLQAEGFNVSCDPGLLDPSLSLARSYGRSLGDRLGHLAQSVQGATHTGEAVAALSELTAPGDGVLQRVVEVLDTTADWWEGMGGTADQRYADRLRLIAEDLGSYTAELQSIRNDLADRHIPHPEKGQAVSSRVSAALASSPSAGQRTVPAGVPTEPSTRAVPPPARPSSAPGR